MTTEAMKLALEALHEAVYKAGWIGMSPEGADETQREVDEYVTHRLEPAITALRTAIEQAEKQEPVAWGLMDDHGEVYDCVSPRALEKYGGPYTVSLYTTPPAQPAPEFVCSTGLCHYKAQREPLTDEQIELGRRILSCSDLDLFTAGARFAEAAHGIKEKNT